MVRSPNYSGDRGTEENDIVKGKYSVSGESEFSREVAVPFDQDEILSERHYSFSPLESHGQRKIRRRALRSKSGQDPVLAPDYRGRGPKGYRRTDESLKEAVSEALYRTSEVDATDIEVFVEKGVVSLKGSVADRYQKKYAEEIIALIPGVSDVFNYLLIKGPEAGLSTPGRFGLTDNITGMN